MEADRTQTENMAMANMIAVKNCFYWTVYSNQMKNGIRKATEYRIWIKIRLKGCVLDKLTGNAAGTVDHRKRAMTNESFSCRHCYGLLLDLNFFEADHDLAS